MSINPGLHIVRTITATLIILASVSSRAQESRAPLSTKHLGKIEQTENPVRKLKKYQRFFHRDSIKQARQMNHFWRSQRDSISDAMESRQDALAKKEGQIRDGINSKIYRTIYKPWARKQSEKYLILLDRSGFKMSAPSRQILQNYLVDHFLTATQNDSMLYVLQKEAPGLQLPRQLTSKINIYKTIHAPELNFGANGHLSKLQGSAGKFQKYAQYGNVLSNGDSLKGFVKTEGSKFAKEYALKAENSPQLNPLKGQLGEANKLKVLSDGYKGQAVQLQDSAYIKEEAKKKAEALAMRYVTDHPEVIQGIQRKTSMLMKKYSIVPNSNDLSTATKRTSLKGKTFFGRLQLAANFQVLSIKPFSLDFSPQAGYKFNSKFVIGIGGLYRKTFKDSLVSVAPDVIGYKTFATYEILDKFFLLGEYGNNSPGVNLNEGLSRRIWEKAFLLGVGRKMSIHPKIDMTLMAGYNFMYKQGDSVYTKPWVIRVGFQTSELAFLNKKKI